MVVTSCICGSLVVLALIAVLGRHHLTLRLSPKADGSAARHDRTATSCAPRPWSVQILRAMGYLPLLDWSSPATDVEKPQVWSGSQLILATTEDETLVLDCLVPSRDPSPEQDRTLLVPITLRAHLPHHRTSLCASDIDGTVGEWVNTGAPVDISLGQDSGIAVLRIGDERSLVTLELEEAHHAP
jgi:hypothetical protein